MSDGVKQKEFREMTDSEKAAYLLEQPEKLPSCNSKEKWQKCLEYAQMRAQTNSIAEFWQDMAEKGRRELEQAAGRISVENDFTDVSEYTGSGSFDAVKFIEDRRRCKTTWDGHILSAEDVQTARQEMAKGTTKAVIHEIIRKKQHERQKMQILKQVDEINRRMGKPGRMYCKLCMGRGYIAVAENDTNIALHICECLRQREQAYDEMKAKEKQNRKRKGSKTDE